MVRVPLRKEYIVLFAFGMSVLINNYFINIPLFALTVYIVIRWKKVFDDMSELYDYWGGKPENLDEIEEDYMKEMEKDYELK